MLATNPATVTEMRVAFERIGTQLLLTVYDFNYKADDNKIVKGCISINVAFQCIIEILNEFLDFQSNNVFETLYRNATSVFIYCKNCFQYNYKININYAFIIKLSLLMY